VKPASIFWWGVGLSGAVALVVKARQTVAMNMRSLPDRVGTPPQPPAEAEPTGLGDLRPFALTQDEIVQAVRDGRLQFTWRELPGHPGVYAFEDAGKIDGVRVPVSARTTVAIAQILTSQLGQVVLPTSPLVEDLIYNAAGVRVKPYAFDVGTHGTSVPRFNAVVDRQIAQQTAGRPAWDFVSCVGKSWVFSNMAIDHPGHPINYGFHWPAATATTDDGPWWSVDGKSKVFQQPGARHNPDHYDYSQTLRLCRLDGGASLPSHETLRANKLWY
jgi:hypothetical protein